MHRGLVTLGLILGLAGCGGSSTGVRVAPVPTPEAAVEAFLAAVADGNLAKMANYWGGARGPAAMTGQPNEYRKRIEVMQIYLRHRSRRILAPRETPDADTRTLDVELTRDDCVSTVPFQLIRWTEGGWIISAIDLSAVAGPDARCARAPGG